MRNHRAGCQCVGCSPATRRRGLAALRRNPFRRSQFCTRCRNRFKPRGSEAVCDACKSKPRVTVEAGRKVFDITGAMPLEHFPGYIRPKRSRQSCPECVAGLPCELHPPTRENPSSDRCDWGRAGNVKRCMRLPCVNVRTRGGVHWGYKYCAEHAEAVAATADLRKWKFVSSGVYPKDRARVARLVEETEAAFAAGLASFVNATFGRDTRGNLTAYNDNPEHRRHPGPSVPEWATQGADRGSSAYTASSQGGADRAIFSSSADAIAWAESRVQSWIDGSGRSPRYEVRYRDGTLMWQSEPAGATAPPPEPRPACAKCRYAPRYCVCDLDARGKRAAINRYMAQGIKPERKRNPKTGPVTWMRATGQRDEDSDAYDEPVLCYRLNTGAIVVAKPDGSPLQYLGRPQAEAAIAKRGLLGQVRLHRNNARGSYYLAVIDPREVYE